VVDCWPVSRHSRSPSVALPTASAHRPREASVKARLARATVRPLTVPAARRAATDLAYRWSAVASSAAGSTRTRIGHPQVCAGGGQGAADSSSVASNRGGSPVPNASRLSATRRTRRSRRPSRRGTAGPSSSTIRSR
jgi:hypothetical protein